VSKIEKIPEVTTRRQLKHLMEKAEFTESRFLLLEEALARLTQALRNLNTTVEATLKLQQSLQQRVSALEDREVPSVEDK